MGIFELTTGGAIGMLGAGLAVCLAGAGSARRHRVLPARPARVFSVRIRANSVK